MEQNSPEKNEDTNLTENPKVGIQSAARRAFKSSLIPAAIGGFLGMSAGLKAGSTAQAKVMLSIIAAGMIGFIFGLIAFVSIYAVHKLRGK